MHATNLASFRTVSFCSTMKRYNVCIVCEAYSYLTKGSPARNDSF